MVSNASPSCRRKGQYGLWPPFFIQGSSGSEAIQGRFHAEIGQMMDRTSVEKIMRETYSARQRGDLEATCQHFGEDAHFAVMGSSEASPVARKAIGSDQI